MKKEKYIKFDIASPKSIISWTERSLPNGELVGKVTKPMRVNIKNEKI